MYIDIYYFSIAMCDTNAIFNAPNRTCLISIFYKEEANGYDYKQIIFIYEFNLPCVFI